MYMQPHADVSCGSYVEEGGGGFKEPQRVVADLSFTQRELVLFAAMLPCEGVGGKLRWV